MESVNNKTFTPLQAGRAYIGTYDRVDAYSSAVISLIADKDCLITMYQSQNRTLEYATSIPYTAGVQSTNSVSLTAPYVYFTVRNASNTDQTYLNFTVIYKTAYPPSSSGGGDVNIFDSTGLHINADGGGNLNVNLSAVNPLLTESGGLKTYVLNTLSIQAGRADMKVWNSSAVSDGSTSGILDAHSIGATNLSVYGTGTILASCTLTVSFSADGITFYNTQYSYTLSTSGDFGFSIPLSAPYCKLLFSSTSTGTITAFMSAT